MRRGPNPPLRTEGFNEGWQSGLASDSLFREVRSKLGTPNPLPYRERVWGGYFPPSFFQYPLFWAPSQADVFFLKRPPRSFRSRRVFEKKAHGGYQIN